MGGASAAAFWRQACADWLTKLDLERALSRHTLAAYGRDLQQLRDNIGETMPAELGPNHIRLWVARLHRQGQSGRSIARSLSAWRGLFDHLRRQGILASNPAQDIRPPKSKKRLPEALSPDAAAQLLDTEADIDNDWLLARDHALFELAYSSGLRLSELTGVQLAQLQLEAALVTVVGKGGKQRLLPVGTQAVAALSIWLGVRNLRAHVDERAVFVSWRGGALSPRAVQQRLTLWGQRQGLTLPVHPHMLRHSFASHLLQSSGDLRAVQDLLGHASIASTQVYTHLDYQHLAQVYDQAHPRARRKR